MIDNDNDTLCCARQVNVHFFFTFHDCTDCFTQYRERIIKGL